MKISHTHAARLTVAAEQAERSNCGQRLGAVLVSGGRVLARGHNMRKNESMVTAPYSHAEHAEMSVLRQCKGKVRGATVYIVRLKNGGGYGNAAPCVRCMSALIEAGVGRIIFTSSEGEVKIVRISSLEISPYKNAAREVITDSNGFYRNLYMPT